MPEPLICSSKERQPHLTCPFILQDKLAMNGIQFLTAVSRSVHFQLFADPGTLRQVCESIIIPNLRIREDVEEMFEMNWVEYVRWVSHNLQVLRKSGVYGARLANSHAVSMRVKARHGGQRLRYT